VLLSFSITYNIIY